MQIKPKSIYFLHLFIYYLDVWQCHDNHGKGIGEKMPGSVASRE